MRLRLIPFLLLALSPAAFSQEPSAKDLRTLLHADVKQYANDGRLVASWSLTNAEQLNAFKIQDEKAIKVASGEGMSMSFAAGGHALCLFKELELEQPCRITFEVKLAEPGAAFEMSLIDSDHPQARVLYGLNLNGAFDVVVKAENGKPVGTPKRARTGLGAAGWGQAVVDLRSDRATLTVNKVEQAVLDGIPIKRFVPAFGASTGTLTVRNLSVDTQVNRDSIRKLFRSVTAARPASRPRINADAGAVSRTAWQKVDEECAAIGMSEAVSAEIDALPSEAKAVVETALKSGAKPKESLASFEKALAIAPRSAVLLWLTGIAAADADLPEKAIEHLEKSVAANVRFAPAWVALGRRRAERGEDAMALKAFSQAETADPADPWVHVARAHLAFDRGKLDEARADVGKACAKCAESDSLRTLAKSLDRLAVRPDWKDPFKKENQWYVVETTISSKVAAEMAQRLVVYRRFLEKAFPLPLKQAPPPSRVWIFDSEDEYHQFASSIATGMDGSLGLYHRMIKTLLLTSKVSTGATQHILFHEGFHQYLDLAVPQAPIWMNEGLAEYFGATTFDVTGKAAEGGIVEMRLADLRGPLVPLEKLMMMPQRAYMHPREAPRYYAQSWALVHYLKQGGNAQATKLFDLYCTAVITGRSQGDAFLLSFGRDGGVELDPIERGFRSYVAERLLKSR